MLNFILIIGIIAAILTILIVLIQNPKGGGLASNFSAGNQLFGAKQTTEGVEKLTWIFVGIIMIVSLVASSYNKNPKTAANKDGAAGTTQPAANSNSEVQEAINAKTPKNQPVPQQQQQQPGMPLQPQGGGQRPPAGGQQPPQTP
ncbi:MAG: preprotein translocase subunit SecG [Bacteroidota bacterium]